MSKKYWCISCDKEHDSLEDIPASCACCFNPTCEFSAITCDRCGAEYCKRCSFAKLTAQDDPHGITSVLCPICIEQLEGEIDLDKESNAD